MSASDLTFHEHGVTASKRVHCDRQLFSTISRSTGSPIERSASVMGKLKAGMLNTGPNGSRVLSARCPSSVLGILPDIEIALFHQHGYDRSSSLEDLSANGVTPTL